MNKKAILHYHLFKNAGTSVDHILENAFGIDKWENKEFVNNKTRNNLDVKKWIMESGSNIVYSSHTAKFPVPEVKGVDIFPIIFVRHPLDRIYSAYKFENNQGTKNFGAVLARNTDFKGYVQTRLSIPNDRQCRNFHLWRFADLFEQQELSEFERAITGLEQLPFIGVVERFNYSIKILESKLKENSFQFEPFQIVKKNTTSDNTQLDERIKIIEKELGSETFSQLLEENKDDIRFYNIIAEQYK